jgi:hypothetical protein
VDLVRAALRRQALDGGGSVTPHWTTMPAKKTANLKERRPVPDFNHRISPRQLRRSSGAASVEAAGDTDEGHQADSDSAVFQCLPSMRPKRAFAHVWAVLAAQGKVPAATG